MEIDATKGYIEKIISDIEDLLKDHNNTHTVESIAEKNAQVKTWAEDITRKFHALEKLVKDENTSWVAWDKPQLSVGVLLAQEILGNNIEIKEDMDIFFNNAIIKEDVAIFVNNVEIKEDS